MKERSPIKILNLRRKTVPTLYELDKLLNLLPLPCIVVNLDDLCITGGNPAITNATGYSLVELLGSDLRLLFTDWTEFPATFSARPVSRELHLSLPDQAIQAVLVTGQMLPDRYNQALFTLEMLPSFPDQQDLLAAGGAFALDALQSLVSATTQADLPAALNQAANAGLALTGSNQFAIYLADPATPELLLVATAGEDASFPGWLPAQDLVHLAEAVVWNESRRSYTALHRSARKNGYPLLASAPLGEPGAATGLVAAAIRLTNIPDTLLGAIQLVASLVNTLIHTDSLQSGVARAEAEQHRLQLYQQAVDGAVRDALLVLNPEGRVLTINPAAEQILGYRQSEAVDSPIENLLIGSEKILPGVQASARSLTATRLNDLRLYRRYGESFVANVAIHPLSVNKTLNMLLVIVQDLSESEQIREQARQLEQRALLGEFTAIFAHEVRNPINNISTGLELMALNLPADDPQQELIQRLQQDCDRLAELMKSVLLFARPADYNLQPVQLPILVQKLLERLSPRLVKAGVRHQLQVEGSLPPVLADYRSLEQALNNLITNAVQAMGESGGQLTLKIRRVKQTKAAAAANEPPSVEISIADTGPGIPKELQERIFQPFFTTSSSGTGLGLAITRRIISAHKGSIHLESFPGGTVFSIRLPLAETT